MQSPAKRKYSDTDTHLHADAGYGLQIDHTHFSRHTLFLMLNEIEYKLDSQARPQGIACRVHSYFDKIWLRAANFTVLYFRAGNLSTWVGPPNGYDRNGISVWHAPPPSFAVTLEEISSDMELWEYPFSPLPLSIKATMAYLSREGGCLDTSANIAFAAEIRLYLNSIPPAEFQTTIHSILPMLCLYGPFEQAIPEIIENPPSKRRILLWNPKTLCSIAFLEPHYNELADIIFSYKKLAPALLLAFCEDRGDGWNDGPWRAVIGRTAPGALGHRDSSSQILRWLKAAHSVATETLPQNALLWWSSCAILDQNVDLASTSPSTFPSSIEYLARYDSDLHARKMIDAACSNRTDHITKLQLAGIRRFIRSEADTHELFKGWEAKAKSVPSNYDASTITRNILDNMKRKISQELLSGRLKQGFEATEFSMTLLQCVPHEFVRIRAKDKKGINCAALSSSLPAYVKTYIVVDKSDTSTVTIGFAKSWNCGNRSAAKAACLRWIMQGFGTQKADNLDIVYIPTPPAESEFWESFAEECIIALAKVLPEQISKILCQKV